MAYGKKPAAKNLIDWELATPNSPPLAFHVGCAIGGSLYIHGGVTAKDKKDPSNKLFQLNTSTMSWKELTFPNSPALSHHACVAMSNRYLVLIGGWDGKSRTSKVVAYDTEKQVWLEPKVSGFPEGGGLSSHTATLLDDGTILILGREGSLRMQRRHGSGYILSGSVESGKFAYKEYTQATASRSGHTANIVGKVLYIVGGRDDKIIEPHPGFTSGLSGPSSVTTKFTQVVGQLESVSKMPGGRKNHIAVEGPDALFIHGGETFDGRSREPVGEMLIFSRKPSPTFYRAGVSEVGRAGHVCKVVGDKIVMHGGVGGKNLVYGETYTMNFNFSYEL